MFTGNLTGLSKLTSGRTRSISPENFTGEKGKGGMATEGTGKNFASDLGRGWKVSPSVVIKPGETFPLAEIDGPGIIQHIWMTTFPELLRNLILRAYWDDETEPSIEVPLGDFFCNGWASQDCSVNSLPIAVLPAGGLNSYWEMPFRRNARLTLENRSARNATVYYQFTYELTEVPEDCAYLHAQWRRVHRLESGKPYTILDDVKGQGHYVGTYLAWGAKSNGWWGEGEVKFYLDGDDEYPTICGTGTEDYFGGAWCYEQPKGQYATYSTAYLGLPQIINPDGLYISQQCFSMYRWHILDPLRFLQDLRVTVQALGWRAGPKYLDRDDDIASVALWYQTEPHNCFPKLPNNEHMEVIDFDQISPDLFKHIISGEF